MRTTSSVRRRDRKKNHSIIFGIVFLAVLALLGVVGRAFGDPLPPPYDTEPFDADIVGNSAGNLLGSFRKDGGPGQFRYFIGTDITAGSLIMDFDIPFRDGPGNDFAILTNSQAWGPLADTALFQFFLDGSLQAAFPAALAPDLLFQFDIPGDGLVVADRIVVTNVTPDPPGINDLATMTFDNAGVAHPIPEPSTFLLLGSGFAGLAAWRWKQSKGRTS